jgi:hypothetical protein
MTGRELFGALTRFLGLLLTTYGIYTLAYEAAGMVVTTLPHRVTPTLGLVFGAIYAIVGLIFLLGAGLITRLAYRGKIQ